MSSHLFQVFHGRLQAFSRAHHGCLSKRENHGLAFVKRTTHEATRHVLQPVRKFSWRRLWEALQTWILKPRDETEQGPDVSSHPSTTWKRGHNLMNHTIDPCLDARIGRLAASPRGSLP
jgi:hypothetical protein